MTIKIITDSTSYIPVKIKEELDIESISLSVSFETETYDEEEIDNNVFYDKMDASNDIPISSQPNINDIYRCFEKNVLKGNSIIGIFISSQMSGTYNTALIAKNMILEKYKDATIEIVDSKTNCMQLGFIVINAAREAKQGKNMENILNRINSVKNSSRFIFIPDNLDYLKKGGRIGGAAALIGNILKIHPVLTVMDGKTTVLSKVRTKAKAIDFIVEKFIEDINIKELGEVIVHHINDEIKGRELAKRIEEITGKAVDVYPIGPVIGLHVGPKAIGIVYYTK